MTLKRAMHYLSQRLWKRFHSQTLILLYHRVANLDTDPQLLSISPEHFAKQMEYISDNYSPISLSDLGRAIESKKIPDKSVVITFDDGYGDNFLNAKPILEKYDIPATIFVASGYIGSNKEFWWDELERLLLLPENLPDHLELNVSGATHKWDILNEISGSQEDAKISSRLWDVTMEINPGPEYHIYRELHGLIKPLSHEKQQHILDELAHWVGLSRVGRSTHLSLDRDQLEKIECGGLIEIGAHTVNHPMLSAHSQEIQEKEIIDNKKYLEDILGHEVNTFSYPFGGKQDFNNQTLNIVREAGFDLACANYSGSVTHHTNPYKLPRYLIRNWDVNLFSQKIGEWFDE